jgi:hypothetical protein
MKPARLGLALERLGPGSGQRFEDFVNEFLAPEYGKLRPVGSVKGDRGRDAVLWQPSDEDQVLLQYSVTTDWERKIRATAKRIKDQFPQVKVLVYVSSQAIGAQADAVRSTVRKDYELWLDVRDRPWFMATLNIDIARQAAAERLATEVVDPYLSDAGILERSSTPLSSVEARAAFVHLGLQWEDDAREKGLTNLCFEALVRAVLRNTDAEHRMSISAIKAAVRDLLPAQELDRVDVLTTSALTRLTKRYIRHHKSDDEYCLTFEERRRIAGRLEEVAVLDVELDGHLLGVLRDHAEKLEVSGNLDESDCVTRIRRVIEQLLLTRGEAFAASVKRGEAHQMAFDDIEQLVIKDIAAHDLPKVASGSSAVRLVTAVVADILVAPGDQIQRHLRSLADSYTLYAFLRETPDVQAAILKMFSRGEIWLDSSILIPLLIEELVEPANRRFTNILLASREAGLHLYLTDGAVDEVYHHVERAVLYAESHGESWRSAVPFLFSAYALAGRDLSKLRQWIVDNFRGTIHPIQDLTEYFDQVHGVRRRTLSAEVAATAAPLREAVTKIWETAHQRRRQAQGLDEAVQRQLVENDVEIFLGVVGRRQEERPGPYGFTSWLLTLDGTALHMTENLQKQRKKGFVVPISPAISPDFMTTYLALGPIRKRLNKATESQLPLRSDITYLEGLPKELLEAADQIRAASAGLPERVIQQRVRDALDTARLKLGPIANQGPQGVEAALRSALRHAGIK